ncbi:MAG: PEP-utilizing enzyme [Patescibacteria group bacterium]|jgi:phosphoenolpyruvate synthase/pyruvate phosphate dikinase
MSSAVARFGPWRIKPSSKLPIFLRFTINSSFAPEIAKRSKFKHFLLNRVYLNHMMYWPAKEYDPFEKEIVGHLRRNDGWLESFCRRELRKSERLYALGHTLRKIDWSAKTNAYMKKTLDTLLGIYRDLMCPWYAQYATDLFFEDAIEEHLARHIPADHPDFRKIVLIFTDPKEMTDVAEEKWELMKLARVLQKRRARLHSLSPADRGLIVKHVTRYGYINRGLATSQPYTYADIVQRIKEAWRTEKGVDQLVHDSSPSKLRAEYAWAMRKARPDAAFKKLIHQARLHSYMRNRRVEAFFLGDYGASFMYHEIARRAHFPAKEIMDVSVPEMYGALEGKSLPTKKDMKQRHHNYAMVVTNAATKLIVDPKQIEALKKKYFVKVDSVRQIQGRMACLGGIIRGRAKVCLDKKEIGKVKKGDILVAQFTTPDYVPAMERAAAIVADQGGLSSHAAIVSRELGVPCVIATENGTRIIKDNDRLEVNAKTGLVKILSR